MRLFHFSKKEKERAEAIGYEGLALAAGEYGTAVREAENILPKKASMKLMSIL